MIEFLGFLFASFLAHWPMHGPQALVKIVAFKSSKIFKRPSLSAVKRTCSEPGLIPNEDLVTRYLKEEIYDFEDPSYGDDNQSEIQMQKLVRNLQSKS